MSGVFMVEVLAVGLGATAVMDFWGLVQKYVLKIAPLNYALLGRWLLWMGQGRFRHHAITLSPAIRGEGVVGWLAHYLTGLVFAFIPAGLTGAGWFGQPTLCPALAAGLLTLVVPFCIMQPALGFGFAASKTPRPARARLMSLLAHLMYGAGLYVTAGLLAQAGS